MLVEWMTDVQAVRAGAEAELGVAVEQAPLTETQIRKLIASRKDTMRLIADAPAETRATVYGDLGVSMSYDPRRSVVVVEAKVPTPRKP